MVNIKQIRYDMEKLFAFVKKTILMFNEQHPKERNITMFNFPTWLMHLH